MTQHPETPRNRLQFEKSPYLLQHADNPVDWYPWGEEAFARAREENKPVFLSIGYSTCHWCHVMAHESFEDPEVAALMNDVFVSIKVDREERPDIDTMYMTVAQLLTGSGGWPLTIIMTPDKKPFYAGTYFPKVGRFGRVGMIDLVPRIHEIWTTEHENALQTAEHVLAALQQRGNPSLRQANAPSAPETTVLDNAYAQLAERFDNEYGGFGHAPKFPAPHNLLFLLRYWKRTKDDSVLAMVEHTLQAMRLGGMYDHIGFGFHRYSTDRAWLLPHFEKMLYDQALLAMAYIEACQAAKNGTPTSLSARAGTDAGDPDRYQQTAREIFTYVLRDMTSPEGGFYSAEDADSEGKEGKFYVWSIAEIRELLDEQDAGLVIELFHFEQAGNFREQATGLKTGENIIHLQESLGAFAAEHNHDVRELRQCLERIRQKLFEVREQRIHPHKDDKILTDWNGLMIAALAKGARAFDEPHYAQAAERAAECILTMLRDHDGRLLHRYRDGEAAIPAHVDDYAFFVWGLIELYETTFAVKYLEHALTLTGILLNAFWDDTPLESSQQRHSRSRSGRKDVGGFYFTAKNSTELPVRQKEIYDGAIPSGNSVAMLNLLRLGRITANTEFEERAHQLFTAFSKTIVQTPSISIFLMSALDFALGPTYEAVIVGNPDSEDTTHMLRPLRTAFLPHTVVLFRPAKEEQADILRIAPFVQPCTSLDGKATAYICQNYVCSLPTTEPETLLERFEQTLVLWDTNSS